MCGTCIFRTDGHALDLAEGRLDAIRAYLTRAVWLLSLISIFTDLASEILYLQSIGFSVLLIGLLEGVAEAVAGLSKNYFRQ